MSAIAGSELPVDVKLKPTDTHGKPALDAGAFQQLLAAVYVLQEHHDRLLEKEPKEDCAVLSDGAIAENLRPIQQMVPLTPERVAVPVLPLEPVIPVAQADLEPVTTKDDSVIPLETAYQLSVLASQLEALIQQQIRTDSEYFASQNRAQANLPVPLGTTRWTSGISCAGSDGGCLKSAFP